MHRLWVVSLLSVSVISAQEFRATLRGTVFDPNQAVVPGAEVTLVNVETSVKRQTVSNADGNYVFEFILPGTYSVTTEAKGFKTDDHANIQINVGETVRVDVHLVLGQSSENVTVSANPVSVATDSSSSGTLVEQDIVESLPIKGHGSLTMYQLVPGIVYLGNGNKYSDDVRPIDQSNEMRYTENGSPINTGQVVVDGVPDTVDVNRGFYVAAYVPSTDSIAEFKLQSGTLPAEFGRTSGSVMNVLLKSGTNDLHGTMYDSLRSSALDANLFFNNIGGVKLAAYHNNNYGFSLGGPVWLPKVYNGKDKTFFFVSYDGSRGGQVEGSRLNVPTPQMRTGDFSQVPTPIYDPNSVGLVNGVETRVPFPGNVIPASEQDPVAQKLMQYWPAPNSAPSTGNPWVGDYIAGNNFMSSWDFVNIKLDQIISSKQQLFARVNFGPGTVGNPFDFQGIASPGNVVNKRPNLGATLGDTYVFSPSVAATFRAGFERSNNTTTPYSNGFSIASLGFPSSFLQAASQAAVFPSFSFNDGTEGLGQGGPATNPGATISTEDAVTIAHGKHLFKTGADIEEVRGNQFSNSAPDGTFSFSSNQTGGPNAAAPSGGFALASMLLGFGSSGSVTTAPAISYENVYYGFYFQDDFRASSKLTINMGMRWEHETPRTENFNRSVVGFAYNTPSPLQVPGYMLDGGLIYAGVNGAPRGIYNPDWHNFSPRLGFAYSLNSKTVIHGGYSLMYVPIASTLITTGYSVTSPWTTSLDGGITVDNKLNNPLPGGALPVTGNSLGLSTNLGQAVSFYDPSALPPAFHNWEFNIQRALPAAGVLTVSYVGSRAIHLLAASNVNINQVPAQDFALGSALSQTVPNPFYGIFTAGSFTGTTIQYAQLLRPYPQFSSVTRDTPGYGNSHYEAMQVNYQKGLGYGLTAVAAFTWSKNLADVFSEGNSPQNFYNRSTEQGYADYDTPKRLTLAFNWKIPVGRGLEFLSNLSKPFDLMLGGWALSSQMAFQDGLPANFSVTGGTYFSDAIRPNVVGNPSQGVTASIASRLNDYFNTAAFARPANFTMGDVAPSIGSVRALGENNVNLSLGKFFPIHERLKTELRVSAFNALNHPTFAAPGYTFGSSSFGVVSSQSNASRQVEVWLKLHF
jgi:Carboxypeptidase regulatory-like domain